MAGETDPPEGLRGVDRHWGLQLSCAQLDARRVASVPSSGANRTITPGEHVAQSFLATFTKKYVLGLGPIPGPDSSDLELTK